ncbi:MAG: tRNA methyltransferase [Candidatus Devosia euplotis]|nr:tRNA methyltransferase [Candidatus Devosia euplotis]
MAAYKCDTIPSPALPLRGYATLSQLGILMSVELALYQSDIANNTGTLIRLCACLDTATHIIHPTGFAFSTKTLARAGLDYLDRAAVCEHDSWTRFDHWRRDENRRLVLLTTKSQTSAYAASFASNDIIMVGRESAGVLDAVASTVELVSRIPMRASLRSINVALAAAFILGEEKGRLTGLQSSNDGSFHGHHDAFQRYRSQEDYRTALVPRAARSDLR